MEMMVLVKVLDRVVGTIYFYGGKFSFWRRKGRDHERWVHKTEINENDHVS